ncbi:MAG: helix-hairpin-helix domain-containing protein, partial [Ferruginibacter sp.]|nr:helix-hairpin-helix domain-containing protein [Ferruginibacter sp.]
MIISKVNGLKMATKTNSHLLNFSKKEKNGIVILCIAILFLMWLPYLFEKFFPFQIPDHRHLAHLALEIDSSFSDSNSNYSNIRYSNSYPNEKYSSKFEGKQGLNLSPFVFDPNTLSFDGWQRIGLKDKTIQTIQNFLSKGGKFNKPEDIRKIWGILPDQADQMIPFIQISNRMNSHTDILSKNQYKEKSLEFKKVDINQSDSADFESLPGIGLKLSARIVNYREKLGGFYSIMQIGETYGLADSVFQKIKPHLFLGSRNWKKININTV